MSHGCRHSPLLICRQLEDVVDQQLRVIAIISLERRGTGPANTQCSFSRRKRPEGMAVPGLIACGSKSSAPPSRALDALWPARSWVRLQFYRAPDHRWHGTSSTEPPCWRTTPRHVILFRGQHRHFSGMYGIGCCWSAWKKRTSLRSSLSEKENGACGLSR